MKSLFRFVTFGNEAVKKTDKAGGESREQRKHFERAASGGEQQPARHFSRKNVLWNIMPKF